MTDVPVRQVRAAFTEETLTVYQAFPAVIAEPAVRAATLVAPVHSCTHDVDQTFVPVDDVSLGVG